MAGPRSTAAAIYLDYLLVCGCLWLLRAPQQGAKLRTPRTCGFVVFRKKPADQTSITRKGISALFLGIICASHFVLFCFFRRKDPNGCCFKPPFAREDRNRQDDHKSCDHRSCKQGPPRPSPRFSWWLCSFVQHFVTCRFPSYAAS